MHKKRRIKSINVGITKRGDHFIGFETKDGFYNISMKTFLGNREYEFRVFSALRFIKDDLRTGETTGSLKRFIGRYLWLDKKEVYRNDMFYNVLVP